MFVSPEIVSVPVADRGRIRQSLGELAVESPGFIVDRQKTTGGSNPLAAVTEQVKLMHGELDSNKGSSFGFVEFGWHADGRPSRNRIDLTTHATELGAAGVQLIMPKSAFWDVTGQDFIDMWEEVKLGLQRGEVDDSFLHPKIYTANLDQDTMLVFVRTMLHKFVNLTQNRRSRNTRGWLPFPVRLG